MKPCLRCVFFIQKQLDKTATEKLKQLFDKKDTSSAGETDAESSVDLGNQHRPNKTVAQSSSSLNIPSVSDAVDKQEALDKKVPFSAHMGNVTSSINVDKMDTANFFSAENTETKNTMSALSLSPSTTEFKKNVSEPSKNSLPIRPEVLELNLPDESQIPQHQSSSLNQPKVQPNTTSTKKSDPNVLTSKIAEEPSGMFSSDDEDVTQTKQPSPIVPIKSPKMFVPSKETVRRVRTRSISKSFSEESDSSLTMEMIASQIGVVLSAGGMSSPSDLLEESQKDQGTSNKPPNKKRRSSRTKSMHNTANKSHVEKVANNLKPKTFRTLKKTKRRANSFGDSVSSSAFTGTKVPKLDSENHHFAIIKSTGESKKESIKAKSLQKQKIEKQDTRQITKKMHPVLASMHSLPFRVGSESPVTISPKPGDFLPVLQDELKDTYSDSDESIPAFDMQLQAFFTDMVTFSPLQEEAPSSSMQEYIGKDEIPEDEASPDADDSRTSISPSANLCTAISFGKQQKAKLKKLITPKKQKSLPQQMISNIRDTPRRFSCEAPSLALSVPPVKPVTKTKSCDPSLLASSDTDSAMKVFNVQPDNLPTPSSTADTKEFSQTLSHVSTGPFKPVPQNSMSETEQMPNAENKDLNGMSATQENLCKPSTSSNDDFKMSNECSKKQVEKVATSLQDKFVLKPLFVNIPKHENPVTEEQLKMGKKDVEAVSGEEMAQKFSENNSISAPLAQNENTETNPTNQITNSLDSVFESVQETANAKVFKSVTNTTVSMQCPLLSRYEFMRLLNSKNLLITAGFILDKQAFATH